MFEAGYFPGAVYLLSTWYARYDTQKRYTAFYAIGCVAAAFTGILAYGLSKMDGISGYGGWRWIFIIEGLLSCAVALFSYISLVGFPEDAHKSWNFLSKEECDFVIRRVNRDRGDAITDPFSLHKFLASASDFKIWVFAFLFFCSTMVGYAINYFLPIILVGMSKSALGYLVSTSVKLKQNHLDFSVSQAQYLLAPPWIFTGVLMFFQAWVSDRYHMRAPIIALNAVLALVGLTVMGFHYSDPIRYFGVFLVVAGASGNAPPILTYQANNIRGHWKRALCSATLVGAGGIGGIAGSLVFRSQDLPRYRPGVYAAIAAQLCILICTSGLSFWFWYCNRRARQGKLVLEGLPGFFYTY